MRDSRQPAEQSTGGLHCYHKHTPSVHVFISKNKLLGTSRAMTEAWQNSALEPDGFCSHSPHKVGSR